VSTPGDLRRLALALPEAYEEAHRRGPAFRVNKRIFAMLGVTGHSQFFKGLAHEDMAVVKLERDDQLNMAAAHAVAVTPAELYAHHGWTYLSLPQLDEAVLGLILRLAWINVAPKRLTRAG
jgi:hypothetical protein